MDNIITAEDILGYIYGAFQSWKDEANTFGRQDARVKESLTRLLAMRVMAEDLIGAPINLKKDGTMTVGFNEVLIEED